MFTWCYYPKLSKPCITENNVWFQHLYNIFISELPKSRIYFDPTSSSKRSRFREPEISVFYLRKWRVINRHDLPMPSVVLPKTSFEHSGYLHLLITHLSKFIRGNFNVLTEAECNLIPTPRFWCLKTHLQWCLCVVKFSINH